MAVAPRPCPRTRRRCTRSPSSASCSPPACHPDLHGECARGGSRTTSWSDLAGRKGRSRLPVSFLQRFRRPTRARSGTRSVEPSWSGTAETHRGVVADAVPRVRVMTDDDGGASGSASRRPAYGFCIVTDVPTRARRRRPRSSGGSGTSARPSSGGSGTSRPTSPRPTPPTRPRAAAPHRRHLFPRRAGAAAPALPRLRRDEGGESTMVDGFRIAAALRRATRALPDPLDGRGARPVPRGRRPPRGSAPGVPPRLPQGRLVQVLVQQLRPRPVPAAARRDGRRSTTRVRAFEHRRQRSTGSSGDGCCSRVEADAVRQLAGAPRPRRLLRAPPHGRRLRESRGLESKLRTLAPIPVPS